MDVTDTQLEAEQVAAERPATVTYRWPAQGEWTYDDYARLPDNGWRYEVIRGELHMSPAPNIAHQTISMALSAALYNHLRAGNLGRVLEAPIDVILPDLASPVQPDIVIVLAAHESIIGAANIQGVPDLVVEILSPSTARNDRHTKYRLYAEAGVGEYWIIDPDACAADVYTRRGNAFVPLGHYERDGAIHSELLPDLMIPMAELCTQDK